MANFERSFGWLLCVLYIQASWVEYADAGYTAGSSDQCVISARVATGTTWPGATEKTDSGALNYDTTGLPAAPAIIYAAAGEGAEGDTYLKLFCPVNTLVVDATNNSYESIVAADVVGIQLTNLYFVVGETESFEVKLYVGTDPLQTTGTDAALAATTPIRTNNNVFMTFVVKATETELKLDEDVTTLLVADMRDNNSFLQCGSGLRWASSFDTIPMTVAIMNTAAVTSSTFQCQCKIKAPTGGLFVTAAASVGTTPFLTLDLTECTNTLVASHVTIEFVSLSDMYNSLVGHNLSGTPGIIIAEGNPFSATLNGKTLSTTENKAYAGNFKGIVFDAKDVTGMAEATASTMVIAGTTTNNYQQTADVYVRILVGTAASGSNALTGKEAANFVQDADEWKLLHLINPACPSGGNNNTSGGTTTCAPTPLANTSSTSLSVMSWKLFVGLTILAGNMMHQ